MVLTLVNGGEAMKEKLLDEGWVLIAIEDGHLVIRTKVPVGWIIALLGAWAAFAGSPFIVKVIVAALGS
jgi:hypothetical protein